MTKIYECPLKQEEKREIDESIKKLSEDLLNKEVVDDEFQRFWDKHFSI